MDALHLIESFVLSARAGSFSAAARRLGMTPAAVSKNVARLEGQLGLRLFHRSTRSLTLTAGGERFLLDVEGPFAALNDAFSRAAEREGTPSGVLKVSVAHAFGRQYLVPLLGDFLARYPDVVPDWRFDNRGVDVVSEGFDAAIGGGIELTPGVIARRLAPTYAVICASSDYMRARQVPGHPAELATFDAIVRRSGTSGRLRAWDLRNAIGERVNVEARTRMIFDDPEAMAHAVALGYGVALLPMPHAAPLLASGRIQRLLPGWFEEYGGVSIYYSNKKQLPLRTRVFVDHVVHAFETQRLAAYFDGR
ncbi:HTH-type transcriptional regulator PgrR [Pandoraea eparura]|jgi:DNA-binding transcriptional LysR family regulator|uniref:HTH-type transcriptional regulator PgrR n=1 Tax=Pandoraea eparura TaxID=2508291 RepID=A0A5E4RT44_9BURK|nr:LysR family transcriptional regulator [Pandoraea eparura]VVD65239.1 HTH-type transcriptional regulator PgrR [Pandoraea eparura]